MPGGHGVVLHQSHPLGLQLGPPPLGAGDSRWLLRPLRQKQPWKKRVSVELRAHVTIALVVISLQVCTIS